jgi:hypothetical protein
MQSAPARPATHFRETKINGEDQEIAVRISKLFANVCQPLHMKLPAQNKEIKDE